MGRSPCKILAKNSALLNRLLVCTDKGGYVRQQNLQLYLAKIKESHLLSFTLLQKDSVDYTEMIDAFSKSCKLVKLSAANKRQLTEGSQLL
jgi:hypothetical protein